MAYDNTGYLAFANALSNAGATLGNAMVEGRRQQSLSDLAPLLQQGKYGEAGAALMPIDPAKGLALIEKQKQMDEFKTLYPDANMAVSPAPAAAAGQQIQLPASVLKQAIIGQESGGNPNIKTSVDGAIGIGQITPGTFARYAKPEERIDNPKDNLAVSHRMIDLYSQKYGDPARVAVAYFSGEGNVAPPGSPTPWKNDAKDGNGKSVSSYVSDVLGRMQGGNPAQVAQSSTITSAASPIVPKGYEAQYNRARWTILNPNMPESAKEAAKLDLQNIQTLAREDRAANRPTDAQRNYNLAKQQGYTGSFMDYQAATKAGTTVNVGAEKAYDQSVGKAYGETMIDLQKSGRNAAATLNSLNVLDNSMSSPNFYSGSGGELVTRARKAAVALGISDAESAAPNELFGKVANKLILDASGGSLGSGFSNADREFITNTVPNVANTPEGNKQIIGMSRAIEQRKIEVAKMARDYARQYGRLDIGFDDKLAQFTDQNPLFKNAPSPAQTAPTQQPQQAAPQNLVPEPPAGKTAEQLSRDAAAMIAANPNLKDAVTKQLMLWKQRMPGLAVPQ